MCGERLSELRKDRGLTQRAFAEQMHVSLNTVSAWERNLSEPDDETKLKLARLFDVSLDYLLGLSDSAAPPCRHQGLLLYLPDLPPEAMRELQQFLRKFTKKYGLS